MAQPPVARTCFVEHDPGCGILRRAAVEGIGTFLLMLVAASAGLQAQRLFPDMPALALPVASVSIAGALAGLIVAFGAVSGGHFNPLITGLQWLGGERPLACTVAYVLAQALGAVAGALVSDFLFGAVPGTGHAMDAWAMGLSELLASAGLMVVVFGCMRGQRAETGPFAVAAWLTGAILVTPSTSYANPALALGALFAAGPIAIDGNTVLLFVVMEILGALIALAVIRYAFYHAAPTA